MGEKNQAAAKPAKAAAQMVKFTKEQVAEIVEKTKGKAEAYARDPESARELLADAVQKAKAFGGNRGPLEAVWSYLTALVRLLRAYVGGVYRDIPWGSIVLVTVGIVYFVCPVDAILDVLPGGLVDDAAVIGFVVVQIKTDLDNFLAWEVAQA